ARAGNGESESGAERGTDADQTGDELFGESRLAPLYRVYHGLHLSAACRRRAGDVERRWARRPRLAALLRFADAADGRRHLLRTRSPGLGDFRRLLNDPSGPVALAVRAAPWG